MSIIAAVLPALINVCKLVSIDLKGPAFISRTIRSSFSGCNVPCCLPVKTVIEFLKAPSLLKDIEPPEFFVQSWTPNSDWLKCPQRVSLSVESVLQERCLARILVFGSSAGFSDVREIHLVENV